jgi:hypothetical protein
MGSILGSVLGAELEGDVEGSDEMVGAILGELDGCDSEELASVLGALRRARGRQHPGNPSGRRHPLAGRPRGEPGLNGHGMHRPSWRGRELAPGVNEPGEGVVPLTMTGNPGQTFGGGALVSQITYAGQLQKPFASRRLLYTTSRVGASAIGLITGQIFVGVDLNQAAIQGVDLEALGAPTAFDTGLSLMQAPPGVIVQIIAVVSPAPTSTSDTITTSASFLGHIIH